MFDDGDDATATFLINSSSATPGTETTYKVVFNANGHGQWPETQTVKAGQTATRPQDLTADGYVFGGWYTDSACTIAFNFATPINQNITIYAKWTAAGGGGGSNTDPSTPGVPTGDPSKPFLWIGLMAASAIGIMYSGLQLEEIRKRVR